MYLTLLDKKGLISVDGPLGQARPTLPFPDEGGEELGVEDGLELLECVAEEDLELLECVVEEDLG